MAANEEQDTCDLTGFAFAAYQKQVQQQQNVLLQVIIRLKKLTKTQKSHVLLDFSNDTAHDDKDLDELLINEVKSYKCLWDPRCRAYKETPKKMEAWKIISIKLSKSGESQYIAIYLYSFHHSSSYVTSYTGELVNFCLLLLKIATIAQGE